jgi:hypothetical protein
MSQKIDFIGGFHAQNGVKLNKFNYRKTSFKTVFKYNIDLLKHLCVVAKIDNVGIMKIVKFLHPNPKN